MGTSVTTEINTKYVPESMLNNGVVDPNYEVIATEISQGVSAIVADLPPVDKAIFLALLYKLFNELAASDWTSSMVTTTLETYEETATTLGDLFENAGGVEEISTVLALIVMLLETDSVDSRLRSRETSIQMHYQQADKLRSQGRKTWNSALWAMGMQVAVSGVGAALAAASMSHGFKQAQSAEQSVNSVESAHKIEMNNQNKDLELPDNQQCKNEIKSHQLNAERQKATGIMHEKYAGGYYSLGETFRSLGQVTVTTTQAKFQRDIKNLEGDEVDRSARANFYSTESEIQRQFGDTFHKSWDEFKEKIKVYREYTNDMMSAIVRNSA